MGLQLHPHDDDAEKESDNASFSESHQSRDQINSGEDNTDTDFDINFILTNAPSLAPKIISLIDMIRELDLTFAAITETWFKSGPQLRQELSDIENATDIKVFYKNRDGRSKRRGGGVALAYRASLCSFRERKIKNQYGFEILCATGAIGRISRRVVIFVIYLPPSLSASRVADLNEVLSSELTAVKLFTRLVCWVWISRRPSIAWIMPTASVN